MVSAKIITIGFAQIPRLRFFARMTGAAAFVVSRVQVRDRGAPWVVRIEADSNETCIENRDRAIDPAREEEG